MTGDFTASYISLMGLGEILGDDDVTVRSPAPPKRVRGGRRRRMDSLVDPDAEPAAALPAVDTSVRAFADRRSAHDHTARSATPPTGAARADGGRDYLLILNIDMGGQFFFRENLNTAGSGTP